MKRYEFQFWGIADEAAMNSAFICRFRVNISFHVSGMKDEKAIAESNSSCMISFTRNCKTIFQGGCAAWHHHQQCMRDPVLTHPRWLSVLSLFFSLVIIIHV